MSSKVTGYFCHGRVIHSRKGDTVAYRNLLDALVKGVYKVPIWAMRWHRRYLEYLKEKKKDITFC